MDRLNRLHRDIFVVTSLLLAAVFVMPASAWAQETAPETQGVQVPAPEAQVGAETHTRPPIPWPWFIAPIGAIVAAPKVADVFQPGHHATTFGGTPLACAAAIATNRAMFPLTSRRSCG